MRVFFTTNQNTTLEEKEVNAIDIVTKQYVIRVRISGVLIRKQINTEDFETVYNEYLDLTEEK